MCGIAGKLHWGADYRTSSVEKMLNKIVHRGPDDSGLIHLDNISLGHRRLSIIDLSKEARQPMDIDNRFFITFNGEIYNYLEIKKELEDLGYSFRTKSDTEVILKSYECWGENCLTKFNGMWAFVIWDEQKKELFAARDRFGKKPFYYQFIDNQFVFASELNGLIQDPIVSKKYSYEALNCYLALGYILAPMTLYEDVKKLEQATYLKIRNKGKKIITQRYWNYANAFRTKTNEKEEEICEHIRYLLKKSVEYRLISDVPVGAFLSGGIDSSSIVAYTKMLNQNDLHTFSIGFNYKSYNELDDANKMANYLNTIHHGEVIEMYNRKDLIHEAIGGFGEPFCDNSLIPMNEVSKLASKFITVVLSGDGADELFAGYSTYKADKFHKTISHTPKLLRKQILGVLNSKKMDANKRISFSFKLRQFLNGSMYNADKAHYLWRLFFDVEDRVRILGDNYRELINDTDPFKVFQKHYNEAKDLDWLDRHLYVDSMTWLPDDILVKVDRTSMQSSIEARAPYLDVNLAEYAASISSGLKMKGNETKYILKKALRDILPKSTLYRKKSGFNAPIGNWIINEELDEFKSFNRFVFDSKIKHGN